MNENEKYCSIKDPREFTEQVRRWDNATRASGSEMGADIEKLLNNEVFLKEEFERVNGESVKCSEKGVQNGIATLDTNGKLSQHVERANIDNVEAITVKFNGTSQGAYDGSSSKEIDITASNIGAAAEEHTHTKNQITDFPVSLKNPNPLTLKLNGTSQGAYDGSTSKNINITASSVGAAGASHTHNASDISSGILPISHGGTGNSAGYITAGQKSGTTLGNHATAEGYNTTASGDYSHADGNHCNALADCAYAGGQSSSASGAASFAHGWGAEASGKTSFAMGDNTTASGNYSFATGIGTIASKPSQFVCGSFNQEAEGAFIVGGGTKYNIINLFRINRFNAYGGTYNSTGADYAEYFEWLDGNPDNEDRRGLFVTLEGDKIRFATPNDDFVLGIVSGNPSIVGDSHDGQWSKMCVSDVFGTPIYEAVEVPSEIDKDGNIIAEAHTEIRPKINPYYDNSQKYKPRSERPEWDAVGMMGKLVVVDDGTCQVNRYCGIGNGGTAVNSDELTKFRVMKRLDCNHIQVLII